MPHVVSFSNER